MQRISESPYSDREKIAELARDARVALQPLVQAIEAEMQRATLAGHPRRVQAIAFDYGFFEQALVHVELNFLHDE